MARKLLTSSASPCRRDAENMLAAPRNGAYSFLLKDVRKLIESSRQRAATALNEELTGLYWEIGNRILRDVLRHQRADYGREIVSTLSRELVIHYGRGFSEKSLRHMVRFAQIFPEREIVSAVRRQISWSHLKTIIYLDDPLKRDFYMEMCRIERWSTRTLQQQIDAMLFERTCISKKPAQFARQEFQKLKEEDRLTPDLIFRDPYLLDFLGLRGDFAERDLEAAILRDLERFLLELGTDFAFVARQKRISVNGEDYYLDLLFYHRRLRRLVAIDLKLGKFRASDKGQMEFYLRWLARYERQDGEENPIGLILCASKNEEEVALLKLEEAGIRVAEYLTQLPPRDVLKQRLHLAMQQAREHMESRANDHLG